MENTLLKYLLSGIVAPSIIIFLLLVLAILTAKKLTRNGYSASTVVMPIFVWGAAVILGIACLGQRYLYPIEGVLEHNAPLVIARGQVTDVRLAPAPPIYYDSYRKSFQMAAFVRVNEQEYYFACNHITQGTWLELKATQQHRVVMDWRVVQQENEQTSYEWKEPEIQLPEEELQTQEKHRAIGHKLGICSFLLFCAFAVLQYPIGRKIAVYLQMQDRLYKNGIVPNYFGLLYKLVGFIPLVGVAVGMVLTGFRGAALVLCIAGVVLGYIIISQRSTTFSLKKDAVVYHTLSRTTIFYPGDITKVQWGKSKIPNNRNLVVTLSNTSVLTFDQMDYFGLQYMFDRLTDLLEKHKEEQ